MSDMDLNSRIQARLAKTRAAQSSQLHTSNLNLPSQSNLGTMQNYSSSFNARPQNSMVSITQLPPRPSNISGVSQVYDAPTIQNMSSQIASSHENLTEAQRELAQTRSKLYSIERTNLNYETELRQKDSALKRTLAETTGERVALVEALGEARAQVDSLKRELDHKDEIVQKQEVRIAKTGEEFKDIQERFVRLENEHRSQIFDIKRLKDEITQRETKIMILNSESQRQQDELNEHRDATLENKVLKQKLASIEHDFAQVTSKYTAELDGNRNLRAEYTQFKQEYSDVLAKFADTQDQLVGHRALQGRFEELIQQFEDVQAKYKQVVAVSDQQAVKIDSVERQLGAERNAATQLSVMLRNMFVKEQFEQAQQEVAAITPQIEETYTYQQFSPFVLRTRQMIAASKSGLEENEKLNAQNLLMKKDIQQLKNATEELLVKSEAYKQSYDRMQASCEQMNADIGELKQQLQNKEQVVQKSQLEVKLAIQQLQTALKMKNKPDNQSLAGHCGKMIELYNQAVQEAERYNQELDLIAHKYAKMEQQNALLVAQQNDQTQELDQTRQKVGELKQLSNRLDVENQAIRGTYINIGSLVAFLLRYVNQQDRRLYYQKAQSEIVKIVLSNYLIEQRNVREIVNQQELERMVAQNVTKNGLSPYQLMRNKQNRRKLRKLIFSIVFVNKLRANVAVQQRVQQLEKESIINNCSNDIIQFNNTVSQIVTPVIVQTGDLKGFGLLNVQREHEVKALIQKLLSNFLSQSVVYSYGTDEFFNLQTDAFDYFTSNFKATITSNQLIVRDLGLQNTELINQNTLVNQDNDNFKIQQASLKDQVQQEQTKYVILQQELQTNYVHAQEAEQIKSQLKQQEKTTLLANQRADDYSVQIAALQTDIKQYQNEIMRLNDGQKSADNLVKTINQKFEEQLKVQMNMKELLATQESQLKQKNLLLEDVQKQLSSFQEADQKKENVHQQVFNQLNDLRNQIQERDRLVNELQSQVEKEQRLRILAENQILKEKETRFRSTVNTTTNAAPYNSGYQLNTQNYSAIPTAVSIMPTTMPPMQMGTQNGYSQRPLAPTKLTGTVPRADIQDLLNQLNTSLADL